MTAGDLFKAGRLEEALATQVQEVKAAPADPSKRLFLFELMAFSGDLDRAERQLDAVRYDDPARDAAVASYHRLIEAERARRRLFQDGLAPQFLAEAPEHARLRLEAVNRLREGRPAEASEALRRASEAAPALGGRLNGTPFEGLRDCDDLFGTVLEVMAQGSYYWVPLDQIDGLALNPPAAPRDLLWRPARLEMQGASGEVFLPALYPGSHDHPDEAVRLGRMTVWRTDDAGPTLGAGLRLFLADDSESSLLEWRQLEVD